MASLARALLLPFPLPFVVRGERGGPHVELKERAGADWV